MMGPQRRAQAARVSATPAPPPPPPACLSCPSSQTAPAAAFPLAGAVALLGGPPRPSVRPAVLLQRGFGLHPGWPAPGGPQPETGGLLSPGRLGPPPRSHRPRQRPIGREEDSRTRAPGGEPTLVVADACPLLYPPPGPPRAC